MKCRIVSPLLYSIVSFISFGEPGTGQSEEIVQTMAARYVDSENDTVEEVSGDFDLTGLKLSTDGKSELSATISVRENVATGTKANHTWYGLYLDLDRNSGTGLPMSESGMDVVFAIEATGREENFGWDATVSTISDFAKRLKFKIESFSTEGNQIKIVISSEEFSKFPAPIIGVWSHPAGKFVDHLEELKNKPIPLFSKGGNDRAYFPVSLRKDFDVGGGKKISSRLPINDETKEVTYHISIRKQNPHEKWLSLINLRLYDDEEERRVDVRFAASVKRENEAVAGIYIDGERQTPHYQGRPYGGDHTFKVTFSDNDEMEFFVNGKLVETHQKNFLIAEARFYTSGTDAEVVIEIE